MPTTRSQGRHEPFQSLQTPPKRARKRNPRKPCLLPVIPQDPPMRTLSMSPEPVELDQQLVEAVTVPEYLAVISYVHASTQTEDVVILTSAEAAELNDRANAASSQKRSRDDESEEEPVAKRHQFSTPQNNKPNNLWMFGERANGDHPRTAPSKPLTGSLRRPLRGPLQKRSNLSDTPRFRVRMPVTLTETAGFDRIKPIEQEKNSAKAQVGEQQQAEDAQDLENNQEQEQQVPQTPRRGLFGSLRGIVHKGWDLAASLTPLSTKPEPQQASQASPSSGQIQYPEMNTDLNDQDENYGQYSSRGRSSDVAGRKNRYTSDYQQPSSAYDHLHYIPANSESVDKAITGQIEPPQDPPTPPSPASRVKAQNPQLSDATIESILKKRERKAALDEQKYGPRPTLEGAKVAPLFGPDSHYARGTVDPRFLPSTPLYGSSRKRKLDLTNEQSPQPRSRTFGIDDNNFDMDVEADDIDQPELSEQSEEEIPPAKKHRTKEPASKSMPVTPRSALKKPGAPGSIGRKSVAFGTSISRDIRGHYGPAGQYKGSTFADEQLDDSRSLSSIDQSDVISPTTRLNTFANSGKKATSALDNLGAKIPTIDFTLRDPNDISWRPSLGNPKPGVFRVPDIDEEDPDESMTDDTPEQPQTPRMSHAELPAPSTLGSSFNESSIVHESTELALDKARLKAEKYKPKSSSRLSEVSRARSRSTSPDEEEQDLSVAPTATGTLKSTAPAVRPVGAAPQPFVPRELDNTIKGDDGMTDFQREHQYDEWAANLHWDAPQTYEDAGTGTTFIHNLIRKNWTEEDTRRSEAFWAREFDEVERAMEDAKAKGMKLQLITGMEEIEGY